MRRAGVTECAGTDPDNSGGMSGKAVLPAVGLSLLPCFSYLPITLELSHCLQLCGENAACLLCLLLTAGLGCSMVKIDCRSIPDLARPVPTGAGFLMPGGRMARRGRYRKDAARGSNGRLSRVGQCIDLGTGYLAAHRLRPVDPERSETQLRILQLSGDLERRIGRRPATSDELATLQGYAESMHSTSVAAKNPNLSFPLGIAHECGFITDGELEAGKHYARLYRAVWGRLRDDIEAALGPEDFGLLLSTGKVASPAPPSSHFRALVAGDPSQRQALSPEDWKRRQTAAHRFGRANAILKADMWVHAVVEGVVISGNHQPFLHTRRTETADDYMRWKALKMGLAALAEHFGFDKMDEKRSADGPRPGSSSSPDGS
jgi:hypothetical protein